MTAKAFLFDANRCTGCQACELACSIENELEGFSWRQVVTLNEAHHPGVPTIHLSLACNHCEEPPCMAHCPALAYSKDPLTGRVELDGERCIGCGYCGWACPYDAPRFDAGSGVMTKCTFCGHRQAAGLQPACVEQCPTGALGFGELAQLAGAVDAPGLPTVAPGPSIRFVPWRGSSPAGAPAIGSPANGGSAGAAREPARPAPSAPPRKISLRTEWPLLGFSLIATVLVATLVASAAGAIDFSAPAFLGLAALGMSLSSAHLGRPLRAWRALLNVRTSWLSREIALFSGCIGLAVTHFLMPGAAWLVPLAAVVGSSALFAVDRVVDVVRPAESRLLHSADVMLTGALVSALLLGYPRYAATVALLKLTLYLQRKLRRRRLGKDPRWGWSLARVGAGLAGMSWWLASGTPAWSLPPLALTAIGEIIDRCELYEELEVPTPSGEMGNELAARLAGSAA